MAWLKRYWHYFAIFGGLMMVPTVVTVGWGFEHLRWHHVFERQVLHIPWGFCLYCLAVRVAIVVEHRRKASRPFAPWGFYGLPMAFVAGLALNQEFLLSLAGKTQWHPGGDFHYWKGQPWEQAKSFADIAGWLFGALAAAWFCYFCAYRLNDARVDLIRYRNRHHQLSTGVLGRVDSVNKKS